MNFIIKCINVSQTCIIFYLNQYFNFSKRCIEVFYSNVAPDENLEKVIVAKMAQVDSLLP